VVVELVAYLTRVFPERSIGIISFYLAQGVYRRMVLIDHEDDVDDDVDDDGDGDDDGDDDDDDDDVW